MKNKQPNHTRQFPRRALLKGAAIAATGLAVAGGIVGKGAMKASSQKASAKNDSRLLDLERQWLVAEAAAERNSKAHLAALDSLPAWARPGDDNHGIHAGWPELDRQHPAFRSLDSAEWAHFSTRPNLSQLRGYNRRVLANSAPGSDEYEAGKRAGRERVRAWTARQREQRGLKASTDAARFAALGEKQGERMLELEYRILETPAETIEGLAAKIRVSARWEGDYEKLVNLTDYRSAVATLEHLYVSSILRDSERLAGGGA